MLNQPVNFIVLSMHVLLAGCVHLRTYEVAYYDANHDGIVDRKRHSVPRTDDLGYSLSSTPTSTALTTSKSTKVSLLRFSFLNLFPETNRFLVKLCTLTLSSTLIYTYL